MPNVLTRLERTLRRLRTSLSAAEDCAPYRGDPLRYCRERLRVRLTPAQEEVCRLVVTPPYKVLVRAGHNVGKSFVAACLVSWWYDCFNPGLCLTTAPTFRQVQDILWKNVRLLRRRLPRPGFAGPKMARLESSPDHFAAGYTARDSGRFQGHHDANVFVLFDEAEGVAPPFWEAAETMVGGEHYGMVAFTNPTTQTGPTVDAEREGGWHVVTMSCLDHPNIRAELDGYDAPFPSAIRLSRLREMLRKWSDPLAREEPKLPTDVELGGEWFRPRAIAQCRLLGIRPSTAFDEVWSDALWQAVQKNHREPQDWWPVQIGCDPAWYGDDYTAIHVRVGYRSVHHEARNGWKPEQTAGRLKQLAQQFQSERWPARRIPILVDLIGTAGGGVVSNRGDYNFVPVDVTTDAREKGEYRSLRSELWFSAAGIAKDGRGLIDVSPLDAETRRELGRQLCGVKYEILSDGRLAVEDKDATKARIGRSPDDADAFNLAWLPYIPSRERVVGRV